MLYLILLLPLSLAALSLIRNDRARTVILAVGQVLLLALLMEKLLRRDAMGGGDIKLLFLTGLFLGWQKNLLCLLLACVVGILWGLIRAKRGQQGLPWGPGIALAAWCAALFGQNLIDWYLSLL